jgi:hypothetical protein
VSSSPSDPGVTIRLAAGNAGVLAAIDEEVEPASCR